MSKKKGLSFEEKRVRMMEIFFETKDVFQLKDIEKIAPKEKGITSMSVKEILQSLVDDGMVDTDRIGTSNYFWAFPSKALHARKRKLEELESQELSSLLLIGVGKHLFISLFATGVHDKKINKLALLSDCTTTLPAFPMLASHVPSCPFIKESFELMQNAFLQTLFSSGIALVSLFLSYVRTALSTSATSLKLQINCIKTCFFPQHELKKQFVNLKTFHQSKLNTLVNAVDSSCLCIECSVTS
ncbi:meiotic nuclear division protein 1 homolog isoform X1 [Caloenas nicobarica]|uniref:meiotic nuclear division protein 1 homolog isoform X1 n=2 Tax=Caloenas nicobarica TaxID=187106 RepID=UPI0032B804B4